MDEDKRWSRKTVYIVASIIFVILMCGATTIGYVMGMEYCSISSVRVTTNDITEVTTTTRGAGCSD